MKKFLLLLTVICTLAISANAGLWTSAMSIGDEKVKPAPFQLDVHGWNVRGYEFVPPKSPHMQCTVLFTESKYKAPVMSCYPQEVPSK